MQTFRIQHNQCNQVIKKTVEEQFLILAWDQLGKKVLYQTTYI